VPQHAEAAWETHSNRRDLRPSDATIDFSLSTAQNEMRLGLDEEATAQANVGIGRHWVMAIWFSITIYIPKATAIDLVRRLEA
jgi:hypothetical protein